MSSRYATRLNNKKIPTLAFWTLLTATCRNILTYLLIYCRTISTNQTNDFCTEDQYLFAY